MIDWHSEMAAMDRVIIRAWYALARGWLATARQCARRGDWDLVVTAVLNANEFRQKASELRRFPLLVVSQ